MRGLYVAAVGFVVLGGIIPSASGDFTPVSQSRSVKATVSGTYIDPFGVNRPPMADQVQTAPDNSPFNRAVTNGFGFSRGVIGGDVSDASQTSQIGSTLVTATGTAGAQAAEFTSIMAPPFQYDYSGTAQSPFEYKFSVAVPTAVSLTGNVHRFSGFFVEPASQASISLSAADGTVLAGVSAPTGFNLPQPYDAPISFTGVLAPGDYTLSA